MLDLLSRYYFTERYGINRYTAIRYAKSIARRIGYDRRTLFRDLASIPAQERENRTKTLQFYSAVDNIGNYTPVLGIQALMESNYDTWNIHDEKIDYDFINANYDRVIIGGAGLLNKCFTPFWKQFRSECELPYIVWGVGGCFPYDEKNPCVPVSVARPLLQQADLLNLRDYITADFYGVPDADISACPTIAYLDRRVQSSNSDDTILYSSHTGLVSDEEQKLIYRKVDKSSYPFRYTDNIQSALWGLEDIIDRMYIPCRLVLTTRLHGAIIAYGLNIPYIALSRDKKVKSFNRIYGNGLCTESVDDIEELLNCEVEVNHGLYKNNLKKVHDFGARVEEWINTD